MEKVDQVTFNVRYAETDQMGRAYHAWYIVWFEMGRSSLFRNAGIPYSEFEKRGLFLPVRRVTAEYERPVHYDEQVTVRTRVKKVGPARIVFASEVITAKGERACHGEVELAVTDKCGKIVRWPKDLMDKIAAMSDGLEEAPR